MNSLKSLISKKLLFIVIHIVIHILKESKSDFIDSHENGIFLLIYKL
jgi:hypothetical protein